jgi:hypothetical protein
MYLLRRWLGAIGSAATFALTGVLALAAVVARFAAALAFAGILSLAGMFFGLILRRTGDLAVVPKRKGIGGGGVLRDHVLPDIKPASAAPIISDFIDFVIGTVLLEAVRVVLNSCSLPCS